MSQLDRIKYQKAEAVTAPCMITQTFGSCFTEDENGDHIYYAICKGHPACLLVYNVDTRQILDRCPLTDKDGKMAAVSGCSVDMGPDGIVCMTGDDTFFTYDPKKRKLRYYGKIFSETAVMAKGVFDAEGNYYVGTYPNACLVKYDRKADRLVELKRDIVKGHYAKAVAIYQNKIFVGGVGTPYDAPFVKYDLDTGEIRKITLPAYHEVASNRYKTIYSISALSEKLICLRALANRYLSLVFDMEKEEFVDIFEGINYMYCSPLDENKTYFIMEDRITARDVVEKETKIYDIRLNGNCSCISPEVVRLKDQKTYPGKSLLIDSNTDGILIANLETGNYEYVSQSFPKNPSHIRLIKAGPGNTILCSAMQGAYLYAYDVTADSIRKTIGTQMEDIEVIDGKCYFGRYGSGGGIVEWDLAKSDGKDENPRQVSTMEGSIIKQDRIFTIVDADDCIAYGSIPYYGGLGGALGIYHKADGRTEVFENIIKNQSVTGLAYRDGKLYGCTAVYGGLGADPVDERAKLFVFDIRESRLERVQDIVLKSTRAKQYFAGHMTWSPDGRLFAGTLNHLIEIDPGDLSVKSERKLGRLPLLNLTNFKWQGYYFEWLSGSVMVTNVGDEIHLVDINTLEAKKIYNGKCYSLTVGEDGNLYFLDAAGTYINRIRMVVDSEKDNSSVSRFELHDVGYNLCCSGE